MKKPRILRYLHIQIALFFLLSSFLLVSLLGVAIYYNTAGIVLKETLNTTATAVDRSGNYIEVYVERLRALSTMIAENPQTIACFTGEVDPSGQDFQLQRLIETALKTDENLVSIVMVSKDGKVVSNEEALDMAMSKDMMKEAWYVNAIHSGNMPTLTSARMQKFSMDKDNWVISISREITDQKGNNIGVLLIDIRYDVIADFLADLDLGAEGYAFIINSENEVVYHKDTGYFEDETLGQELVMMAAMADGYDAVHKKMIHHRDLENTDWTLVGVSSLDGLKVVQRQIIESLIFASAVLLIIVVGSSVFFASRITNPIRRLEKAMAVVEMDLAIISVEEKSCYEAQNLARHFNEMMVRIRQLMSDIQENEKNLRRFEIAALHSQINPHFLYNTLDTIVWMAEFNDQEKVIAITKSLAQFFRISLSQGEVVIPLIDEVDHVRQYLFIQKQRYGDKLLYAIDMDPELGTIQVPKIILQPIVENAIYHGIRELDRPGHIWIRIYETENRLKIEIEDDGMGFDPETRQEKKPEGIRLGGIGIRNVDERIRLHYGEGYGTDIQSQAGRGTRVTLTLGMELKR